MPIYLRAAINRNPNIVIRYGIIEQIDAELLPESSSRDHTPSRSRSFALCGFGGLGKTQTAALYALEKTNAFDAIFWVQASDVDKLYKGFCAIAEALGFIDESDERDVVVIRDRVLQWLCDPRKQQRSPPAVRSANTAEAVQEFAKWLIIFDNADNIEIVSEFWPLTTHGSILVTSRDPLAKTDLAMKGIDLPPMTRSECVVLLDNLVTETVRVRTFPEVLSLVESLGYLPLAVSQIATRIRRSHMTMEEYLGRHAKGSLVGELNKVKALPPREQYRFTVSTAWRLEAFSPRALCLMRVMAFMNPDAVAERILRQDVAVTGLPLVDEIRHLCLYPGSGDLYVDIRAELLQTSLVSRNTETKTLGWNKLVQEVVREKMTPKEQHIHYQIAIDLLYRFWESTKARLKPGGLRPRGRNQVLPHMHIMVKTYDSAVPESGLPLEKARQLVKLLHETGW
jgi:hypothetical protein